MRKFYILNEEFNILQWNDIKIIKPQLSKKKIWSYYFPFLYFYNFSDKRKILWKKIDNFFIILLFREFANKKRVDLFYPPLNLSESAIKKSFELVNEINGDKSARIMWVDEEDANFFKNYSSKFDTSLKEKEYIYNVKDVISLSGKKYRDIRKRISYFKRFCENIVLREYTNKDCDNCLTILKNWEDKGRESGISIFDVGYTKATLQHFKNSFFPDIIGMVIEINGKIKSFMFGGEMNNEMANFFILKTDHTIKGLSEYMRYSFFLKISELGYNYINDASDLNISGLKQHKEKFRPCTFLNVYLVKQIKGE